MRLVTFGGLKLEGSEFTRPTPLLLLTYLALNGSKSRADLARMFYSTTKNPRDSLSTCLKLLRKVVPENVTTPQDRIIAKIQSDVHEYINLINSGQFDSALDLYRGPFLNGFSQPLSEEVEGWMIETREYLAAKKRKALLTIVHQQLLKGRVDKASMFLDQAIILQDAPELSLVDIEFLGALTVAADSSLVSQVVQIANEFDIVLPQSQSDAFRYIKNFSHKNVVFNNLPLRRTQLIGREIELFAIAQYFAKPDFRILTIYGPGGIGKSCLALEVAHDQLRGSLFHDGIAWISLESTIKYNAIPYDIARALGIVIKNDETLIDQIIDFVNDKRMLLIFDNFEHLVEGANLLSNFLQK